ncbi:MAG TPA: tetratricopeptide repeat protein [Methylomirabilota bacterium]|nr:tetratricopeptide repeat protein [Methylomirabilota bacterium]
MTRPAISRLWIAPLLLFASAACTTAPPSPWGSAEGRDAGASQAALGLVARADDLVERGQARAALATYERALREHPGDPAGASALYGLGRLQADGAAGLRNYRAAHRAFSRLLTEYPDSRWHAEARAWRAVITDLIAREDEAARLKTQIEHLRRTDLDLERRRR